MIQRYSIIPLLLLSLSLIGCSRHSSGKKNKELLLGFLLINANGDPGEQYSGGYTTVFDTSSMAFNLPAANMTDSDHRTKFNFGNAFFNTKWTAEGNAAHSGLGPTYNNFGCNQCHQQDGRGRPPLPSVYSDESNTDFQSILIRLSQPGVSDSQTGGPVGLDNYGTQFENHGIKSGSSLDGSVAWTDVLAEGTPSVSYDGTGGTIVRTYADGSQVKLIRPKYSFVWNFGDPGSGNYAFSPRVAPMIPGMGLLAAIPESTLQAWEDPDDADGDGISGRINYVWDIAAEKTVVGRFGWKANEPSMLQQNQGAFSGDVGISGPLFPNDSCPGIQADTTYSQCSLAALGTVGQEASQSIVEQVAFYSSLVGVPARRNWTDQNVTAGKELFLQIGCSLCHKPLAVTGNLDGFPEVSKQYIKPYTDLLLHDMGDDLADGRSDFTANGNEWRTAPLWGIGLVKTVNGHQRFLHDGRANGFEEAILWHGGEAKSSRINFQNLSALERQQILQFLETL